MDNLALKLVVPSTVNRTVPLRKANSDLRSREYLTIAEVTALAEAAKRNRQGQRDATMILIAFRHGLRATELVRLKWDQVSFQNATLYVRRVKQGTASVHPLSGTELRALRALKRSSPASPFLFVSERAAPLSTAGFARMLERCADGAGLAGLRIHPHMLRHACGFALANAGHDTRSIQAYLVIGISSTQSDIPSCRRSGSKSSGKTEIERTGKVSPLGGGKPPVLYYPNRRPQRSQWSGRSKGYCWRIVPTSLHRFQALS